MNEKEILDRLEKDVKEVLGTKTSAMVITKVRGVLETIIKDVHFDVSKVDGVTKIKADIGKKKKKTTKKNPA